MSPHRSPLPPAVTDTAAGIAGVLIKRYLAETGKSGTVTVFGCPGEEGGSGKTRMAGKAIALAAIRLFEDETILSRAWEEFRSSMGGKSDVCPIPDEYNKLSSVITEPKRPP